MKARIDDLWLETGSREFAAEMSDLGQSFDTFACPGCRGEMTVSEVSTVHRDGEGDMTHWTGRCICGARLTIFND